MEAERVALPFLETSVLPTRLWASTGGIGSRDVVLRPQISNLIIGADVFPESPFSFPLSLSHGFEFSSFVVS